MRFAGREKRYRMAGLGEVTAGSGRGTGSREEWWYRIPGAAMDVYSLLLVIAVGLGRHAGKEEQRKSHSSWKK